MRKKLPFSVGLLLRLLKRNHRVFITCTTSFDRSPACVIAYLHWMTDTSLHAAYNFVVGLHSCKPDRFFTLKHLCISIILLILARRLLFVYYFLCILTYAYLTFWRYCLPQLNQDTSSKMKQKWLMSHVGFFNVTICWWPNNCGCPIVF